MSSTWRFPKIWINATLGWIAKAIYESSDRPWFRSLFGTRRSRSTAGMKEHEQVGDEQRTDSYDHNSTQPDHEHELEFLDQFNDVFHDLDFLTDSSDYAIRDEDLSEAHFSAQDSSHLNYADQLLTTDEDQISELAPTHQFNQDLFAESVEYQSQNQNLNQQTADFNLQDAGSIQTGSLIRSTAPQGATKIKLYDEEREKQKAERRKKRKKQERKRRREKRAKRKSKAQSEARNLSNDESTSDVESIDKPLVHDQIQDHSTNTGKLNTWRRPPLRSLSKWERIGQAQMSQWQRYSPSSKVLLFGSWFASLESLVEVDREMKQEREQFYQLVESHEEFSSFSATELDAWWFQLNRVDYFVTEYQFQKKLEKQNRSLLTPVRQKALISEATEINEHESTPDPESFDIQISIDLPEIQTFSPQLNQGESKHFEQNERTSHHTSLSYDSSQSIDSESGQAKDIEEDIILRPIKKRKRKRRSKL